MYDIELWENVNERAVRLQHEKFEKALVLMVREPPMETFFRNVDIKAVIGLCCNLEQVAEILKCRLPQVVTFYDEFDFESIYDNVIDTRTVRSMMDHFKPKTISLGSSLGVKLPYDLLNAFTLHSPKKCISKIRGFGQNFLIQQLKMEEVHIENLYSENSSFATNAILEEIGEN